MSVDLIAGSVTDSAMGEEYVERELGVPAANARRNGARLFELVNGRIEKSLAASAVAGEGEPAGALA